MIICNSASTLFDLYAPTRDSHSIEVRVRSSSEGAVALVINDEVVTLDQPVISYQGISFFRYRFNKLPAAASFKIEACHMSDGLKATVHTSTLAGPLTLPRLRIGILSDLHLSPEQMPFEQYRPGVRRLTGLGYELALRYIQRLEMLGAEMIVMPGDLVDPCTEQSLVQLKTIMRTVSIPCYPIIGNHEPWSRGGEELFYGLLGLPSRGYYAVRKNNVLLIMLSTPAQESLNSGSGQLRWLQDLLASSDPHEDIVIFSHFSLLLHPCVRGANNDGYQLLDNHQELLGLLAQYANVRLFVAGHKNVPSMVEQGGVIHTLSPQLIQSPCGYDLFTLYSEGVMRTTYEIDEQHYGELARAAYHHNWRDRYGDENGRNFYVPYK